MQHKPQPYPVSTRSSGRDAPPTAPLHPRQPPHLPPCEISLKSPKVRDYNRDEGYDSNEKDELRIKFREVLERCNDKDSRGKNDEVYTTLQ